MPHSRRHIRIKIFQAVYAWLISGNSPDEVFDDQLRDTFLEAGKADRAVETEDDAMFIKQLFYTTVREFAEVAERVQHSLENWDLERIATTDRVLIALGMVELLHFPTIPVKVSINEYIEIAKQYSTEKSGSFVNGVLDALHHQLVEEGRVKKTGRGLLDAPVNPS